ncbi:nicotinamide-nucleotide adenylyltransferase [Candidatus Woesearchaeota archaeon]|nr:nicotinamide-nucleotide adenylyltransferase [Candidatus Woesearchaeota archaeon]
MNRPGDEVLAEGRKELNLVTVKQGCELCGSDVTGNRSIKYLCRRCNVLYDFKMIGLFIGRFQPFHKGHLQVIRNALEEVEAITIVVAIPLRDTGRDPFTAEERIGMIQSALEKESIRNYDIVAIKDIPSDEEYVNHVRAFTKPFNVVFVGDNKLNEKLFREAGFRVITSQRFFNLDATQIRDRMRKGEEWEHLVPAGTVDYIKEHDLVDKVKDRE